VKRLLLFFSFFMKHTKTRLELKIRKARFLEFFEGFLVLLVFSVKFGQARKRDRHSKLDIVNFGTIKRGISQKRKLKLS